MTQGYRKFLSSKTRRLQPMGFEPRDLSPMLKPWQAETVAWAVRRGRAALFEDCGLGKSFQQLEWAAQVHRHTGGNVIIHCPVGVRQQTLREAEKFQIPVLVRIVDRQNDVKPGVSLVNYEKLHHFDPSQFGGVVLDESQILKNYTGKIKRKLLEAYARTPCRLACTATPAPNDRMELGNQADFLGVMPSNEMLSRWFINDTMKAGGYRLKRHAVDDFWRWCASWAICIEKPSDIGHSNEGYELPPLNTIEHLVELTDDTPPAGWLFDCGKISATNIHGRKRKSIPDRAAKAAEIVAAKPRDAWLIWCQTNYEADELRRHIPEAVEVRGNHSEAIKEERLLGFSAGEIRILLTKPTVAGLGMNWQHCHNVVFAGLNYSYEEYYQAIRRVWRFGQSSPVDVHLLSTPTEVAIRKSVDGKKAQHVAMQSGMAQAMKRFMAGELHDELTRAEYTADKAMGLPAWFSKGVCQ